MESASNKALKKALIKLSPTLAAELCVDLRR
ncbi:hypothetical protein FHT67_002441 [Paenibacillus sp. BK720]|nr:hypothetical protein [Paenibacillus sp. BK720]